MKKYILIIGSKTKNIEKAVMAGYSVILFQKPSSFDPECLQFVQSCHLFDYEDSEELLIITTAINNKYKISQVVTFSEYGMLAVSQVSEELGLPGVSVATCLKLKNKALMRDYLNEKGFSTVRSNVGSSYSDISHFLKKINGPIIIKPVDGTASSGIFFIDNDSQITNSLNELMKLKCETFIMEEFISGPEYSVESFSYGNGDHFIAGIAEKFKNDFFVETGHLVPARLSEENEKIIANFIIDFLDIIGLHFGFAHTEIILSPNGPKIVESHTRVGGDKITDLVSQVYGIDYCSHFFDYTLDNRKKLNYSHTSPLRAVSIRFITPNPGIVNSVSIQDRINSHPGVLSYEITVKPGDEIKPATSSHSRAGYILVNAASNSDAVETMNDICSAISINVNVNGINS